MFNCGVCNNIFTVKGNMLKHSKSTMGFLSRALYVTSQTGKGGLNCLDLWGSKKRLNRITTKLPNPGLIWHTVCINTSSKDIERVDAVLQRHDTRSCLVV